ncbi:uncharacterized protein SETTUDRAFT_159860 [Exserohilum turcica Et28A]|uniref:Uncharacterized protein n=1 Tax=Exserohilum turcicum (strain 28A) TaxID=671987 RepID=R0IY50_EXST2|nr:uncharacterized protein SETTUDRAFT_159860 [Exserohilum turcica Et28A]EOA89491.1 hypothetical protein SETTUDRAFT_159860 [Exserohilum turcica Et28A]
MPLAISTSNPCGLRWLFGGKDQCIGQTRGGGGGGGGAVQAAHPRKMHLVALPAGMLLTRSPDPDDLVDDGMSSI